MKLLFTISLVLTMIFSSAAQAENWAKVKTAWMGYSLSLEIYAHPRNMDDYIVSTPLYIYSDTKKQGAATGIFSSDCPPGQVAFAGNCYSCPPDYEMQNFTVPIEGWNKCIGAYSSTNTFDSFYTEALLSQLVNEGSLTARQKVCIVDHLVDCYIIPFAVLTRYGGHCGIGFGQGRGNQPGMVMDNVDKCCWGHDTGLWSNNLADGVPDVKVEMECANNANLARCMYQAKDRTGITASSKAAAESVLGLFRHLACGDNITVSDTSGNYPWEVSGGYNFVFEDEGFPNNPNKPIECGNLPTDSKACKNN